MNTLPPDTPITALLADVARQIRENTNKAPSFFAIPRKLALKLVSERAEALGKPILTPHMETLLDARVPTLLLAMLVEEGQDAVPILAIDMQMPMVAGWTWPLPRFVQVEGFEEHPEYPAMPFSRKLWDGGKGHGIPNLLYRVQKKCVDLAYKPAPAFATCMDQFNAARPLQQPAPADADRLSDDPAIAIAAIEEGMEERAELIEKTLAETGVFGCEFEAKLHPDVLEKLPELWREKFGAHCEIGPHPKKAGWLALVATREVKTEGATEP